MNMVNIVFEVSMLILLVISFVIGFRLPVIGRFGVRAKKFEALYAEASIISMSIICFIVMTSWMLISYLPGIREDQLMSAVVNCVLFSALLSCGAYIVLQAVACMGVLAKIKILECTLAKKYYKNSQGKYIKRHELSLVTDLTTGYLWARVDLNDYFLVKDKDGEPVITKN